MGSAPAVRAPGGPAGSLLLVPPALGAAWALVGGAAGTTVGGATLLLITTFAAAAAVGLLLAAGRLPVPSVGPAAIAASVCLGLVATLAGASTGWSLSPAAARDAALVAAAYAAAFLLGLVALPLAPRPGVTAAAGLAVLGTLATATAIVGRAMAGAGDVQLDGHLAGAMEDPSLLAVAGIAGVLGGLALIIDGTARERAIGGALAAGNTLAVVLTGSRVGLALLLISGALLVGLGDRRPAVRLAPLGAVLPALVLGFWIATWPAFDDPAPGRAQAAGLGLLAATALACLVGAGISLLLWLPLERRASMRRELRYGLPLRRVAFGVLVVALCGIVIVRGGVVERGAARADAPALSTSRTHWWGTALRAIGDRPGLGWGAGAFPTLERSTRNPAHPTASAHDTPLDVGAGSGVLGALLIVAAGLLLAGGAFAGVRLAEPDDDLGALVAALAALTVVSHGLVDASWQAPALGIPALVALGGLCSRAPRAPRRRMQRATLGRSARAGWIAIGVVGIALAALCVPPWLAARHATESTELLAHGDARGAEREAATAVRRDGASIRPALALADGEAASSQPVTAAHTLVDAARREPRAWTVWWRLGRIAAASDPATAEPVLARASRLSGGAPAVAVDLAAARRGERPPLPPATALCTDAVLRDVLADGTLTATYAPRCLHDALGHLTGAARAATDAEAVLVDAIARQTADAPAPSDQAELAAATRTALALPESPDPGSPVVFVGVVLAVLAAAAFVATRQRGR